MRRRHISRRAIRELFTWYEPESEDAFQRVGRRLRNINADPKGETKRLHDGVVLIPGVGHFASQEKPAEFNQALAAIVKQFTEDAAKK